MSGFKSKEKGAGKWVQKQEQQTDSEKRQWAALRRRYEWKDSYDETGIAPRDEDLENELFGEENHVHTGINFSKYEEIKVNIKSADGVQIEPINSFDESNLHKVMKENIELAKYKVPTPVQKYSIPIITSKKDLMACAQTGSGKTAAFLIPVLSQLFGKRNLAAPRQQPGVLRKIKSEPLVLIIAPSRELATQIFDECRKFTYRSMMRPCVVYGGADPALQKEELAKGCDVLTATPGRLKDFLERGIISLRRVKFLVLDEADRMLDMGFEDDIRIIVQKSDLVNDGDRQTLMFSATFPKKIQDLAQDFLAKGYIFLTVGRVGGTTSDITQKILYVEEEKKRNQLVEMLLKQPPSRTLIFVKSKRGADSLDEYLYNQGFPTTSIHGDRTQREREDALISFKNGRAPILIATSVAARGLDIKNVMHVINYDLCEQIDEYVHRIGRTARVGNKGLATSFYNENNSDIAYELVKILMECNQEIPDFLQSHGDMPNDEYTRVGTSNVYGREDYKGRPITWDDSRNNYRNNQNRDASSPRRFQQSNFYAQGPPLNSPQYASQPERGFPVVNLPKANNQYNSEISHGYSSPHMNQNFNSDDDGSRNRPLPGNNWEPSVQQEAQKQWDPNAVPWK
ncbi:6512_t:CDS:10 [Acaulospora morrowiae]|uniref:ATP-dependent RNA helicase DED1 n=1 Tax=Acaulospora morrowiae TaxID=94023 RepID=A0A9N9CGT9_9GLOM|nr:6512_t:CDS:10 [Acaulospora morrowiae]